MFWSKTWFLLIALVGALAVAVALLAARPLQRDLERETGARLERAQHSASLLLKVNARKWIDTAAQVATDAVLVEALEQATKGPADLGLVHKTVQERLRYFNDKMKVDLVMGDRRARAGDRARRARRAASTRTASRASRSSPTRCAAIAATTPGRIGGKLYRVAASPVIARDRYVGSLVVGQEVAGELAQSMKRVLDVDVAFLLRGRVLASSAQMPLLGQLPLLVDQHFDEMTANGRSMPLGRRSERRGLSRGAGAVRRRGRGAQGGLRAGRAAHAGGDVRRTWCRSCWRPIRRRCRGCSWRRSAAGCCWR